MRQEATGGFEQGRTSWTNMAAMPSKHCMGRAKSRETSQEAIAVIQVMGHGRFEPKVVIKMVRNGCVLSIF